MHHIYSTETAKISMMSSGCSQHFKGLCEWVIDKITTQGVGDEYQFAIFPLAALTLIVLVIVCRRRANMTDSAYDGNAHQ